MGSFGALGLSLLAAVLLVKNAGATQLAVGGSSGWAVPSDNGAAYDQWAQRMRFQIGDSLLFVYSWSNDSVLRVTKEDFKKCNCASPLEKYTDGHTVVGLSESGPHYFISGNKENCQKNEKLVVVVLADRSNKGASPAPAPSPTAPPPIQTPSPAPSSTAPPPAPPVQTPSPSPTATTDQSPPSPTPEATSTPAPTQDDNHNDASKVTTWSVLIGVFVGSVALLIAI